MEDNELVELCTITEVQVRSPMNSDKEVSEIFPKREPAEELSKIYEQITGPFEELTFRDLAKVVISPKPPPADSESSEELTFKTLDESPGATEPSTPAPKSIHSSYKMSPARQALCSPRASTKSKLNVKNLLPGTSPKASPLSQRSLQEELSFVVPRSPWSPHSKISPTSLHYSSTMWTSVEHGSGCCICQTKTMIIKTRCLVCGKVYCRSCVKEGMGSMAEGRKCRSCLGKRFSQRYIARAGKGWWLL